MEPLVFDGITGFGSMDVGPSALYEYGPELLVGDVFADADQMGFPATAVLFRG